MSDTEKHELRPLTELEDRLLETCTKVDDKGRVWLATGHQFFQLDVEPEDATHAYWFRRQLAIALARIVELEKPP